MADTKAMEMIAENLIAHLLQRHGIFVAKPYFDQDGGDLLAMTTKGGVRSCRIQCKGRTVRPGKGSNVTISVALVKPTMIVCLFVEDGSFDDLNLYVFFADDIKKWATDGKDFELSLAHGTFAKLLKNFRVRRATIERLANEIMKVEAPTTAEYVYTPDGGVKIAGAAPAQ
jgi:hypothetical protein